LAAQNQHPLPVKIRYQSHSEKLNRFGGTNQHSLSVEIGHKSREKSDRFGGTKLTRTACRGQTPKQMSLSKIEHI